MSLDDIQYIEGLYRVFLGRLPSIRERDEWLTVLRNNLSDRDLFARFDNWQKTRNVQDVATRKKSVTTSVVPKSDASNLAELCGRLQYPVFIVGSPRSGTSVLVDALTAAGYCGFREGHLLSLISIINNMVDHHFGIFSGNSQVLISNVDKEDLKSKICEIFKTITNDLNAKEPWFDKTGNPEMILSIPIISALWPESVFIYAKRRAIENIKSRLKKFPSHSFEAHCRNWTSHMSAWRRMREILATNRWIEIDQQRMIRHPEATSKHLQNFLHLDEHAKRVMTQIFESARPQESAEGSAEEVLALADTGWSQEMIDIFTQKCGSEMEAYGYSFDAKYFAEESHTKIS